MPQDPLFRHAPFPLGPAVRCGFLGQFDLGVVELRCHARRADRAHDPSELRPRSFAAPKKVIIELTTSIRRVCSVS